MLSETQWMAVGMVVVLGLLALVAGYLWRRDETNGLGVPLQAVYPMPTKNQEWSYGHEFVPPEQPPPHDPGHSVESGAPLTADYCRWGTTPVGIVDGENDLNYFNIYTVQPSMYGLKYYKQSL